MTMRRVFFCALPVMLLAIAFTPAPRVLADDPNHQTQLKISVWPEYDKPSVLVMLDGTLADAGNLPREIALTVPAKATILATTYTSADGAYAAEQPYNATDLGDGFKRVTYSVKAANYHLEYYDDLLRGLPDKTMDFVYRSPAVVDQLVLEVQQPLLATNFAVTPQTPNTRSENGFTFYTWQFSNVAVNQTVTVQARYTKNDSAPSVAATPVSAPLPATAPAAPAAPSLWSNVYLVAGLVVVGLAAMMGLYLYRQRAQVPAYARSRRPATGKRHAAVERVFCTQCGRELKRDDNFCPKCGAKHRMT